MKTTSKSKGNKWENQVLRDIRKFYPDAYKTIGSGNAADDKGDLVFHKYCIECKHHKRLSRGQIDKFWNKIVDEAGRMMKEPLLIFKENNRSPTVLMFKDYGIIPETRIFMFYDEWLQKMEVLYGQ